MYSFEDLLSYVGLEVEVVLNNKTKYYGILKTLGELFKIKTNNTNEEITFIASQVKRISKLKS